MFCINCEKWYAPIYQGESKICNQGESNIFLTSRFYKGQVGLQYIAYYNTYGIYHSHPSTMMDGPISIVVSDLRYIGCEK